MEQGYLNVSSRGAEEKRYQGLSSLPHPPTPHSPLPTPQLTQFLVPLLVHQENTDLH
jgi:hypothetical protein